MFNYIILDNNVYYLIFENVSQEEFNKYDKFLNLLYTSKINFKIFYDLTKLTMTDCTYCYQQIQIMKKYKELTKQYLDKSAILLTNTYVTNALELIFQNITPTSPNYVGNTKEDCLNFLLK